MQWAINYLPNSKADAETCKAHMEDWKVLANRYGQQRFENALGNVLRRQDYWPQPRAIEDECKSLRMTAETPPGSNLAIYECPQCFSRQASSEPQPCLRCTTPNMIRLSGGRYERMSQAQYEHELRNHSENFVKVSDVIREWVDKRRREGKPVNAALLAAIQERAGDAA